MPTFNAMWTSPECPALVFIELLVSDDKGWRYAIVCHAYGCVYDLPDLY